MERYCEFCFMVYESPKKKKEHLQTEYHVKKEKRARREENFENYIQQHYPQMMSQYKGTTLVHYLEMSKKMYTNLKIQFDENYMKDI